MPAPTDISQVTGTSRVYVRQQAQLPWVLDFFWIARSVELGSNDRISAATVEFNRSEWLGEGAIIPEPVLNQDSMFLIAWQQEQGNPAAKIMFVGTVSDLHRTEGGAIGGSVSTGIVPLKHVVDLWSSDVNRQVAGAVFARLPFTPPAGGSLVQDTSQPVHFNAGGKPNRSIRRAAQMVGAFTAPPMDVVAEAHYFVTPDGFDYDSQTQNRLKARYWTYAQAINYLLWFHADVRDADNGSSIANDTRLVFGQPIGIDTGTGIIYDEIRTFIDIEASGETYELVGPPPPLPNEFSTHIQDLLTAKMPDLDVTGINVWDALVTVVRRAGLGIYLDSLQDFADIDIPPEPADVQHKVKIWAPGGALNHSNPGPIFTPRLEKYFSDVTTPRTGASVVNDNQVADLDVHYDYNQIVTRPAVQRAPTLYEITAELRPLWRPVHPSLTTSLEPGAYFDNIVLTAVDGQGNLHVDIAEAEAGAVFRVGNTNPEDDQAVGLSIDIIRRMRYLASCLNSAGDFGKIFYDVGRKWGLPCDRRYPNNVFARANVVQIPATWKDYSPVNFNEQVAGLQFMTNPIDAVAIDPEALPGASGAETWPHRARRFLPCLIADPSGQSPGVIVELSFNSGDTWFPFDSITVADDETAIWLNYKNPMDVRPPKPGVDSNANDLVTAFLRHKFRVRITATIEGSDQTTMVAPQFNIPNTRERVRIYRRQDRYRRHVVISQFKDETTADPSDLIDQNDWAAILNPPAPPANPKRWFFRPVDDSVAMRDFLLAAQVYLADPKVSGVVPTIPWVETDVHPGMVVPFVDDAGAGGGSIDRNLDFQTSPSPTDVLAPHVVSVLWTMEAGNFTTQVVVTDWRATMNPDLGAS